jgi:hypothetical protein
MDRELVLWGATVLTLALLFVALLVVTIGRDR